MSCSLPCEISSGGSGRTRTGEGRWCQFGDLGVRPCKAPFEVSACSQGELFTCPAKHALPCLFVVIADYAVIDPGGDDGDVALISVEDIE